MRLFLTLHPCTDINNAHKSYKRFKNTHGTLWKLSCEVNLLLNWKSVFKVHPCRGTAELAFSLFRLAGVWGVCRFQTLRKEKTMFTCDWKYYQGWKRKSRGFMIVNHTSELHPPPVVLWFILTTVEIKPSAWVEISRGGKWCFSGFWWLIKAGFIVVHQGVTKPTHKSVAADVHLLKRFNYTSGIPRGDCENCDWSAWAACVFSNNMK